MISWIVSLYTAGFYSLDMPHRGYKTLSYLSIITAVCTLIGFALFYLSLKSRVVPKTILALHSIAVFTLITLWRGILNRTAAAYAAPIAFIGINDTVTELLDTMRKEQRFSYLNYDAVVILDAAASARKLCAEVPVIDEPLFFADIVKKQKVQIVVIANEKKLSKSAHTILFELLRQHIRFMTIPDFYELLLRRIPLAAVNDLWFLKSINLRTKEVYGFFKSVFDRIAALAFLLAALPFFPVIILLIKLESFGPAFFTQERIGFMGRPFKIIKFRTMKSEGNSGEPASPGDARVTPFGKFLRRTRIDEIPQAINVIKGEMSFIGPRPERPELIFELEKTVPFYRQRLLVKPGISGWDQVSGEYHSPSLEDTYKKVQYDLYYIKNMSFFLDLSIFFKTIVTIVKRAGV